MAFGLGLAALITDVENAVAALAKADPQIATAVTSYVASLAPVTQAVLAPTVNVSIAPASNETVN